MEFIYRTPAGYKLEFIEHDLAILNTDLSEVKVKKIAQPRKIYQLTDDIRLQYGISIENDLGSKNQLKNKKEFAMYYAQNYKDQFYLKETTLKPEKAAEFDDVEQLTIYTVDKDFPTFSPIQKIIKQDIIKIPCAEMDCI